VLGAMRGGGAWVRRAEVVAGGELASGVSVWRDVGVVIVVRVVCGCTAALPALVSAAGWSGVRAAEIFRIPRPRRAVVVVGVAAPAMGFV
jgi:hypothetical protein